MFNFDWSGMDWSGLNTIAAPTLNYEALAAIATQAAVASPAVVSTPANVAPSAPAVQAVVEKVIKAVAPVIVPDASDAKLSQLAKQTTQAVVTNPAVIAAPAGQTVNTTTIQGIIAASTPIATAKPTDELKFTTMPTPTATSTLSSFREAEAKATTPAPVAAPAVPTATSAPTTSATTAKTTFQSPVETALGRDIGTSVDYSKIIDERVAAAQAVAAKPVMSEAQKSGGGVVKWIGGVDGKYEIVMPIGSPLVGSTAAGWEPGRNNLAGQPTGTATTTATATTATTTSAVTTTPVTSTAATVVVTPTVTTTPTTTVVTATPTTSTTNVTDPATLALIQSLQSQVASLTKAQTDAANKAETTAAALATQTAADKATARKNAIDVLTERFQRYGLGSLVNKIKELAVDGATEATITLGLQETEEYKQRFKANQDRIKKGLQVLNPAEYLNLEDGYRQVLRAYGLKSFDTDAYVQQFIANDVSAAELSNRVVTAVQRVQNADPAISRQLRDYYGIGQSDLVAYVLDPEQQFQKIERQVAAAEIGVAAGRQGLKPGISVAEQLAAQGVSQAEAQKGYATIADILPTAEKLSDIYGKTMDTYGQSEAEQEVFNSLASAQRKRQKLTAREVAAFSGTSGTNRTSLTTSTVGQF